MGPPLSSSILPRLITLAEFSVIFIELALIFGKDFLKKFPQNLPLALQTNLFENLLGPFRLFVQHVFIPTLAGLLRVILIPIVYYGRGKELAVINKACGASIDADMGGDAVRYSTWVQEAVLLAIALSRSFHPSSSGAEEVGGGSILTHASLGSPAGANE